MRLRRAHAIVSLEETDGTALLEALGTNGASPHLAGYLAAESLMFRILKGAVESYLHVRQTTEVVTWQPASGACDIELTVADPDPDQRYRIRSEVTLAEEVVMRQEAEVLPLAGIGERTRSSSRPGAPAELRDWALLDRWTPTAEAVRTYSGWGHPNLHTDEGFARAAGYHRCLVQGLMIQNRGLSVLEAAGELPLPFRVQTRFRAPAFVGDPVAFRLHRAEAARHLAALDPDERTLCECEVSPA